MGFVSPVLAQPTPAPPNEGGPQSIATLRENLEIAVTGYIEAEQKLEASKSKQAEVQRQLTLAELDMTRVKLAVSKYAAEAYRTGRLGTIGMMLQASTQDELMERAVALNKLAQYDQARMAQYLAAKRRTEEAKAEIERLIAEQNAAVDEMKRRQTAAERALAVAGGTPVRVDVDAATLPDAEPAPRNSDGTWPSQGRTVKDPTTGSMITPRLLHAYNETRRLGWTRYVSCYRSGGPYEHPKGRACDWSTSPDRSFEGTAKLADKVYGDRLASFYVKNAKALGVMYVVWYCTIWLYGSGWRKYNSSGSRCGDSPNVDHTNHVHLSVY
ncbi:coiled-coil domain-containing protein [Allorhizocola rhizosphaerae]|uniref:coiled-coil domain-containing protein n=1 Tax=Allorhizocola rhizosphaerae TaxID=1872709 RepID=UPI001FEBD60E|nr:hypothetical protein [Allorhizocola rhizosphaerae]